jgi:hypothetical protein
MSINKKCWRLEKTIEEKTTTYSCWLGTEKGYQTIEKCPKKCPHFMFDPKQEVQHAE